MTHTIEYHNICSSYQTDHSKWDDNKKQAFIANFFLKFTLSYDDIVEALPVDVNGAMTIINDLFKSSAIETGMPSKSATRFIKSQPPWWNDLCDIKKNDKYKLLRRFRRANNETDLLQYKAAKREFKSYVQGMKLRYQAEKREEIMDARKDPKSFWNLLKKRTKCPQNNEQIPNNVWFQHFSELFKTDQIIDKLIDTQDDTKTKDDEMLNSEITENEIMAALKKLSVGKSPGPDKILTEYIKNTIQITLPTFTLLFNCVFRTGNYPDEWSDSIICPIFKSGCKKDPKHYRGISLINSLGKLYSSVLNNRLYKWAELNSKTDEAQAGFREGYSTTDDLFTLHALIQKYLTKKHGRLYVLYVDFTKAFDNILHPKLFSSLLDKGINGSFLRALRAMYRNLTARIKGGHGLKSSFPCLKGNLQGNTCSPLIFVLFINDICSHLRRQCGKGIFVTNNIQEINTLLFADNVANPVDTVIQLQHKLNAIKSFCDNTGMQVNIKKNRNYGIS